VGVMRRIYLAIFVAMGLLPSAFGAQEICSKPGENASAANAAAIRKQLHAVKFSEEMDTNIPADAQRLIPRWKSALSQTARAVLACNDAAVDPKSIESELATMLAANPPQPPASANVKDADPRYAEWLSSNYGSNLLVSVKQPKPQLLSVQFQFRIECGYDTIWMLFELQGPRWKNILTWQAPPYTEISGAFGDFFLTSVLQGDVANRWRVVVAHGKPWCTSRFSGFGIDVLAPSNDPDHPRVVWHAERGYSRGDAATRLQATADGFELRLNAPADDANRFERKVIYSYRVDGDHVTRVEPIAADARGFVEEWLSAPWDEAKAQTAPDAVAGMMAVHERVAQSNKDANTYVSFSYGPVRPCLMKGQYEVEMIAAPGGPQFYSVKELQNGYAMVNYGTTQDERCNGPDVMKKR
jgi:hypothetical protein